MTAPELVVLAIGVSCLAAGMAGLFGVSLRARLRREPRATVRPDAARAMQEAIDTVSPCCCRHDSERKARRAKSRRRADARRLAHAIVADPDRWRAYSEQVLREGPES